MKCPYCFQEEGTGGCVNPKCFRPGGVRIVDNLPPAPNPETVFPRKDIEQIIRDSMRPAVKAAMEEVFEEMLERIVHEIEKIKSSADAPVKGTDDEI